MKIFLNSWKRFWVKMLSYMPQSSKVLGENALSYATVKLSMGPSLYTRIQDSIKTLDKIQVLGIQRKLKPWHRLGHSNCLLGCKDNFDDRLPSKRSNYERWLLLHKLQECMHLKRPDLAGKIIIFHQDNASVHTCVKAMVNINNLHYDL